MPALESSVKIILLHPSSSWWWKRVLIIEARGFAAGQSKFWRGVEPSSRFGCVDRDAVDWLQCRKERLLEAIWWCPRMEILQSLANAVWLRKLQLVHSVRRKSIARRGYSRTICCLVCDGKEDQCYNFDDVAIVTRMYRRNLNFMENFVRQVDDVKDVTFVLLPHLIVTENRHPK